eukprot:snap_masked-scaffold_12-processed-gene-11.64-mRNA-1 protein AED:1.00 eAED:1.00 QI:0/-1/0/0/-1/1/1/0/63
MKSLGRADIHENGALDFNVNLIRKIVIKFFENPGMRYSMFTFVSIPPCEDSAHILLKPREIYM